MRSDARLRLPEAVTNCLGVLVAAAVLGLGSPSLWGWGGQVLPTHPAPTSAPCCSDPATAFWSTGTATGEHVPTAVPMRLRDTVRSVLPPGGATAGGPAVRWLLAPLLLVIVLVMAAAPPSRPRVVGVRWHGRRAPPRWS